MGLWLWDDDPKFTFSLADELTTVAAALVARCGLVVGSGVDADEPAADPGGLGAEVIDLAAVRAAREERR